MSDRVISSLIERMLRSPLDFEDFRSECFEPGFRETARVVPSFRFIVVREGCLDYTVEEETRRQKAGAVLLVPPWVWRSWHVSSASHADLIWTVFEVRGRAIGSLQALLSSRPASFELIRERMESLFALKTECPLSDPRIEGEFKATIAHFLCAKETRQALQALASGIRTFRNPHVEHAVNYLQAGYSVPSVLSQLAEHVPLHPDYLRDLFRQQMHMSPNRYLTMLRMRAARYFLRDSSQSIKEIAGRVGYPDPQYFSRTYRKFWGRSPIRERDGTTSSNQRIKAGARAGR